MQQQGVGHPEAWRSAFRLLRRAVKEHPGARTSLALAEALLAHEELRADAQAAFRGLVDAYPKDERAPAALLRLAELRIVDGDEARALEVLEELLRVYPDSPSWPAARQRIADLRFARVRSARAHADWPGLRTAAQAFAETHPVDPRADGALMEIAAAWREEKKFREAVDAYLRVAAKAAGLEPGHKARLEAATVLADDLNDPEAALKELERVPEGMSTPLAVRLRAPSLALKSERVFTSAEAPAASLTVRNLETVRFRLWTLDVRDYFDRKGSTAGVQDLEVSVIAPDQEWEFKVPGYAPLKEFALPVPLPRKEPGAYVVLASSGALEAKTVVLVSDLAILARAGRQGTRVLAQNMRTGARVEVPSVLTSADGRRLKAWTPETLSLIHI